MDENGLGALVGMGVLILVSLISASLFIYAIGRTNNQLTTARDGKADRISERIQTDIIIENAVWDSATKNLILTVKNTGSTVLSISKVDLLENGVLVSRENINDIYVEGVAAITDVWLPEEELVIRADNILLFPIERVKAVTQYGVSDYTENVVAV